MNELHAKAMVNKKLSYCWHSSRYYQQQR